MISRQRALSLVVATMSFVVSALANATGAPAATSSAKLKIGDACTFVTEKQIGDAFGTPVEFVPVHAVGTYDCVWNVAGGPAAGGGRFQTYQLFPNFAVGAESAHFAYVDERSIDTLSESHVQERRGLGKASFVNFTENHITVEVNKKLAFTLIWEDADPTAELKKSDVKKLVSLAKKVIRRTPK